MKRIIALFLALCIVAVSSYTSCRFLSERIGLACFFENIEALAVYEGYAFPKWHVKVAHDLINNIYYVQCESGGSYVCPLVDDDPIPNV